MRYNKPPGYNTIWLVSGPKGRTYKPNNGFLNSGLGLSGYAPAKYGQQVATLTFTGTPANGSTITIPDDAAVNNPGTPKIFTFTYGGSPGVGIIPLVGGGGTAAQAAAAAQVAFATAVSSKLSNWIAAIPGATNVLIMTSTAVAMNRLITLGGVTNITLSTVLATFGSVVPGRFGRNYCVLPNGT